MKPGGHRWWLAPLLLAVYLLHQDFWWWRETRPLVLGFLPLGLAYHGAYCLVVAAVMFLLVRKAWPDGLEEPARENSPPH
jgi:hypothetical protein